MQLAKRDIRNKSGRKLKASLYTSNVIEEHQMNISRKRECNSTVIVLVKNTYTQLFIYI